MTELSFYIVIIGLDRVPFYVQENILKPFKEFLGSTSETIREEYLKTLKFLNVKAMQRKMFLHIHSVRIKKNNSKFKEKVLEYGKDLTINGIPNWNTYNKKQYVTFIELDVVNPHEIDFTYFTHIYNLGLQCLLEDEKNIGKNDPFLVMPIGEDISIKSGENIKYRLFVV